MPTVSRDGEASRETTTTSWLWRTRYGAVGARLLPPGAARNAYASYERRHYYSASPSPPVDLDLPRTVVGFGFVIVAAWMDWRSRMVKDEVWVALGAISLVLVEVDLVLNGTGVFLHLMTVATAILYFGVFFGEPIWDNEEGLRLRPVRLVLYLAAPSLIVAVGIGVSPSPTMRDTFWQLLVMPGMVVIAHGLYYTGLLRGGADAKAAMALGLLFPGIYPHFAGLPIFAPPVSAEPLLAVWFPFAFLTIMNSALLFLAVPIAFLVRNLADGTAKTARSLFGYTVPIDHVPTHAWILDRVEGDRVVRQYTPQRRDDQDADRAEQVRLLKERGVSRVWVTPKLPFITAILAGYVLTVVVGNPFLALFGLR